MLYDEETTGECIRELRGGSIPVSPPAIDARQRSGGDLGTCFQRQSFLYGARCEIYVDEKGMFVYFNYQRVNILVSAVGRVILRY
ncbi:hypothetical protein DMN91_006161 [Ooceraea biroi]|uniref:Uncharacterized protein n=1 Tax=Ooceraea biroi TaxID=2015173 RepID=A0A3L8DMV9_OOCBI|nr:hypothetical protein DMN91_006161 [Ooceraea biroi]